MRQRRNPLVNKILNLGLDLQGGSHLLLELQTSRLPDDRLETVNEAMDRAIEVIRNRIDQYGLSEPLIVRQGQKWIVVQLPGVKDRNQAKDLIGRTALSGVPFGRQRPPAGRVDQQSAGVESRPSQFRSGQMPKEIKVPPAGGHGVAPRQGIRFYVVKTTAEMTGAGLKNAALRWAAITPARPPTWRSSSTTRAPSCSPP
jgi:preprotein translocase subunit SecD